MLKCNEYYFLGADLLKARQRAAKKLVSDDDMSYMLQQTTDALTKVMSDMKGEGTAHYTKSEIIGVRNTLVAAATVRLARRSKELMTMTVEEVADAESIEINDQEMFIVKVSNYKFQLPIVYKLQYLT